MAILQALLAMLGRSASKILNAIFGWAVVALFGRTPKSQQLLLTALVAAAAAWPLLLVGIAFPRAAALIIAFVPLQDRVPPWVVRVVWIALALLVPIVLGLVVAARAPPGSPRESFAMRVLRGFPITLGIATAFLFTFIAVPILKLISIVRRRTDEHIPYITTGEEYQQTAKEIARVFARDHVAATRAAAPFWLTFPAKAMQKLGGRALRGFVANELAYWRGPDIEVALQPSDIIVRGGVKTNAWVHGLLSESLAKGPGKQSYDPDAQELESQLQEVWGVYLENPEAHRGSAILLARVDDVARELAKRPLTYDQWQVVYRVAGQVRAAINGAGQLLATAAAADPDEADAPVEAQARARNKKPRRSWVVGPALFALFGGVTARSRMSRR